jgi:YebC/PmpR family DNA-binding regulatory protein
MSGHSKWATIHRAKEIKDAKKGAIFTKMGANIVVAVRSGGGIGDPEKNFRLRLVIDKARQFNMPKENIARAIEKGMGTGEGINLTEVMYEGFLPGGCAVLVEALTDNRARTSQKVRSALEAGGGTMASLGAVSYMFTLCEEIRLRALDVSLKDISSQELELIDLGIDDFENEGEFLVIYCHKEKTEQIKNGLEKLGYSIDSADVVMKPITYVEISDEQTRSKIEKIIEELEDLDDVTKVYSNYA